jgi:hypothetical protein
MLKRLPFIILIWCTSAVAQQPEMEANLKAVFIYNFIKYIDWNAPAGDPFIIGVIGSSPIYHSLQEIAKKETINGKQIIIHHFTNPDEITPANILYITANSPFSLSAVLLKTEKTTLTIGEEPGFAEMGTAFNFVLVEDKLKFEANLNVLAATGLRVSSQLLKLAIIVK